MSPLHDIGTMEITVDFTVGPAVIELNNRETAVTFWLGVLVLGGVAFMVWTDGIAAIWGILRLLFIPCCSD